jgi:hypothetical protein
MELRLPSLGRVERYPARERYVLRDSDDFAAAPDLNGSVDRADIVRSRAATSEVVGSIVHDLDEVSAARPAVGLVPTGATLQVVGAKATPERIVAEVAEELVVASEAADGIAAPTTGYPVALVGAGEGFRRVRACNVGGQDNPGNDQHHERHRTQQED